MKFISKNPFILVDNEGEQIDEFERLGVYYSKHSWEDATTLHKIGKFELVEAIYNNRKLQYEKEGLKYIADELRLIDATDAMLEDINFLFDRSLLSEKYFKCLEVSNLKKG